MSGRGPGNRRGHADRGNQDPAASDVRLLNELGHRDFGENRDAEAAPKAAACADLDLSWHFIGQLQTNKAASVARYANFVHSVDRLRLVRALGPAARRAGPCERLVEVSLDGDPARGGAWPAGPGLAEALAAEEGLGLGGVMAIAPLGMAPLRRLPGWGQLRRREGRQAGRDDYFGRYER